MGLVAEDRTKDENGCRWAVHLHVLRALAKVLYGESIFSSRASFSALSLEAARAAALTLKVLRFPKTSAMASFTNLKESRSEVASSAVWGRGFGRCCLLAAFSGGSLFGGFGRSGQVAEELRWGPPQFAQWRVVGSWRVGQDLESWPRPQYRHLGPISQWCEVWPKP